MAQNNDLILTEIRGIREDLAEVKDDQKVIKEQVAKTNGRVTALEVWRAGKDAVTAARGWVIPAVVSFLSGAGLVVVAFLLNRI